VANHKETIPNAGHQRQNSSWLGLLILGIIGGFYFEPQHATLESQGKQFRAVHIIRRRPTIELKAIREEEKKGAREFGGKNERDYLPPVLLSVAFLFERLNLHDCSLAPEFWLPSFSARRRGLFSYMRAALVKSPLRRKIARAFSCVHGGRRLVVIDELRSSRRGFFFFFFAGRHELYPNARYAMNISATAPTPMPM